MDHFLLDAAACLHFQNCSLPQMHVQCACCALCARGVCAGAVCHVCDDDVWSSVSVFFFTTCRSCAGLSPLRGGGDSITFVLRRYMRRAIKFFILCVCVYFLVWCCRGAVSVYVYIYILYIFFAPGGARTREPAPPAQPTMHDTARTTNDQPTKRHTRKTNTGARGAAQTAPQLHTQHTQRSAEHDSCDTAATRTNYTTL